MFEISASHYVKLLEVDEATVRKVLTSWGPGKFDAELNLDGKAFRPDGKPAATLNPPDLGCFELPARDCRIELRQMPAAQMAHQVGGAKLDDPVNASHWLPTRNAAFSAAD